MPAKKRQPSSGFPGPPLAVEKLVELVWFIRGEKVILDSDLARLYAVETKALNQAARRNSDRFPADFMFQLDKDEMDTLLASRSQFVTLKRGANLKYPPYAFTEQGIAMLSSVLKSPRAIEVNIAIMRTFVQLRRLMDSNALLAEKIEALEKKYDQKFQIVFDAIRKLIAAPATPNNEIGFHTITGSARTQKRTKSKS